MICLLANKAIAMYFDCVILVISRNHYHGLLNCVNAIHLFNLIISVLLKLIAMSKCMSVSDVNE